MLPKRILCASHGTPGARAAEAAALAYCGEGVLLVHLLVVPDFWKGMMGDDWLNNAVTRERYGTYLETQLEAEAAEVVARFGQAVAARGARFQSEVKLGKPTRCLLDLSRRQAFDLVVVGSPRPKGMEGLRSRLDYEALVRALGRPLRIEPHPNP